MQTSYLINLTIQVIGSLALFLFGMKYMSEALQRFAGNGLRHVLASFTSNRLKAVLTGAFITSAIQSSSATTVMVVSFVNAGLLQLSSAIGVIMGSNIGTTLTAWIITLFGIKFDISNFSIPIIGLGFICMMLRKKSVKHIGEFLVGFGLLFLGLAFLKDTVNNLDLAHNESFKSFIYSFISDGNIHFGTILLFVLIGTVLTVILQSSSAMIALTIILCSEGAIPFEMAVALVLGENIGTTITANIAAIVGNVSARRAARSHLIFNLIGVLWILCIFRLFIKGIDFCTIQIEGISPYTSAAAIPIALSLFHSTFNILNTCILVWFIPQIEHLTKYMVKKQNEDEDEIFKLEYIDSGFMKVGEISIELAKKEVQVFSKRMTRMFEFIPQLLSLKANDKDYTLLLERIQHYEEISDRMEIEIANYLTKTSGDGLSPEMTMRTRGILRVVDNLESIGDQNYQLAKLIDHKNSQNISFSPEMLSNIENMFNLIRQSLEIMNHNIELPYKDVEINDALEIENKINCYRDILRRKHLEDLDNKVYSYINGIAYSGIYSLLEKVGDHIINITEAIVNAKYTKDERLV